MRGRPRHQRRSRLSEESRSRRRIALALVVACAASLTAQAGAVSGRNESGKGVAVAERSGPPDPTIEPEVCTGCEPPLLYNGGPVLSTNTAGGLTVTPIFWLPGGGQYAFPDRYESIIDGYIANVAAASRSTDNVYSVATEYYDKVAGKRTFLTYSIRAGTPIVDTQAFPSNGCSPADGYTACVTDAQLRTELTRIAGSRGLPTDLAHFYPVFFPPKVETQDKDGTTSAGDFCGYHRSFGSGANQTIYGDEPFPPSSGCSKGQAPNGSVAADAAIDTLSHELNEAITDPVNSQYGWFDKAGHEIGDMCGAAYGRPLGHTSAANPQGTEYNQVINGGKYYTQAEFSNLAFSKLGFGKGCALSEALAQNPSAAGTGTQATTITTVVNDATPTTLPADGKSTSKISMGIADQHGFSVPGDHVYFDIGVQSGTGQCGTLSGSEQTTNADGNADVTYTASSDNVSCWVVATEALAGRSAEAVIYQGTTQKDSPTFHATFPTSLEAGGSATTFTAKATNPTSEPIPETRIQFVVFPGPGKAKNVNAGQVHLSYSTTGPTGTFTDVPLAGSTGNGNAIQGYVGPEQGVTLPANSTATYTFHVTLAPNVPVSKTAALLAFEGYLNQINDASGSGATLADTYATDIKVPAADQSHTALYAGVGIGALVVVLAIVGALLWKRRKNPPRSPQAETASP